MRYYTGGYRVIEAGDNICSLEEKEAIFIANHQTTSDTTLLMTALGSRGLVSGRVLWVMDHMFKYTNFGWISQVRGDFFIAQGKDTRQAQLTAFKDHLINIYLTRFRKWIVLFPEGGFLRNRLEASQNFAKKHGYPVLNHCTLPRLGAIKVILDTLAEDTNNPDSNNKGEKESHKRPLKWLIDVTIGYPPGGALSAHGVALGWYPPTDTILHYRAYPVADIPKDTEGLTTWLYARYTEKDQMLENYYKNGTLEDTTESPKRVLPLGRTGVLDIDVIQIIMFHMFYLVSTYIHYVYLLRPILSFIGL
ncbi:acyl-CoA:lysophosphatidylglycerol acyltransferase 1 [Patella vulgata]|uniref:acyl-CoA:lysophosphatidylglycerol acyltransferase 1 n=1 Tax=Patella vulgata TaxID=6465 RepID=UPI0024A90C9C|nr:acyl-CoA:lysophosphatidylglycerol acyltransferase 1 [Patella vulgata]